ncbi:uncharacterized protein LOC125550382 [Triticum urartu]|uniref:uncharacterized protein LOC125550382 n=1 Tax=Triticum urartu TaxID=4572 RepID=UPI0020441D48|nr:uncharacterized protein LOC125550382 [Triticum urartu]
MGLSISVFRSHTASLDADETAPPQPWVLVPSVPALVIASGFMRLGTYRVPVDHPFVSAVDSSGLLLCSSNYIADNPRQYFLWDAAGHTSSELPQPDPLKVGHPSGIGLLRKGTAVLVADLQRTVDGPVLCYWEAGSDRWLLKRPSGCSPNFEISHGVLSHRGRLFWFNLAKGISHCDPFLDTPVLCFIALPLDCEECNDGGLDELARRRCIKLSLGQICLIDIQQLWDTPALVMWSMNLADEGSQSDWVRTYRVPLCDVWSGWEPPMLSLVHPYNPNILYLSNGLKVTAVDMLTRRVIEVQDLSTGSSSMIHAWILTPELQKHIKGSGKKSVRIVLGGMPMLSRPVKTQNTPHELSLDSCPLNLDILLEIVKRCSLTSVVKFALSCKLIRRNISSRNFLGQLGRGRRFTSSIYLGHFENYCSRLITRPHFIPSPLPNAGVLPRMVHSSLMEERSIGSLIDLTVAGIHAGVLVLSDNVDPEVCLWCPLKRYLGFAPQTNLARNCGCILSTGTNGGMELMLVKARPRLGVIRTKIFTPVKQDFAVVSRHGRPPLSGVWGPVVHRQIIGDRSRNVKPFAFPVVVDAAAHWLCRSSGKYRVLKMPINDTSMPSYIPLPTTCCSTVDYHKDTLLLVSASADGHVGGSDQGGLLGLLSLDAKGITVWSSKYPTGWTQHGTICRDRIIQCLDLPYNIQFSLEWCSAESGVLAMTAHGKGHTAERVIFNLNTLEGGHNSRPEGAIRGLKLRAMCPYEADWVGVLSSLKML